MSSVVLSGDSSGSVTLTVPSAAGSNTATVPAQTGTLGMIAQGTAVATTSGTSVTFASIPSWVKRITLMFSGFSTSGTSIPLVKLGTSGGLVSTGYLGTINSASGASQLNYSTYIPIYYAANLAANIYHGTITFNLLDSSTNTWTITQVMSLSNATSLIDGAGSVALGGTLTQLSISTVSGTDTFDAGIVNILYEG